MIYTILSYIAGAQHDVEIACEASASVSVQRGLALRAAVRLKLVLRGADLAGAYLRGADLAGADLRGAVLAGADLGGADLRGAYLRGADLAGAVLGGAVLRGAYLRGADLAGADLRGADVIDGGQRSDGYRFVGHIRNGVLWIAAGCRYMAIRDAREWWQRTRGGTPLGAETMAILDHIERVAAIRGLTQQQPRQQAEAAE